MEYGIITVLLIGGILLYMKFNEIKKRVNSQQAQLDDLCKTTGNEHLSSVFVSEEDKAQIKQLKYSCKRVAAIKKVRELTSMDLLQVKEYIDKL